MNHDISLSKRTGWNLQKNEFAELLDSYRQLENDFIDLTLSNPTQCGFKCFDQSLLKPFQCPENLIYHPQAFGSEQARQVIAQYYRNKGLFVEVADICLTGSTSEAYTFLFRLLADAGDEILYPQPSYPLFSFLGEINDVNLIPYPLEFADGRWNVNFQKLEESISDRTRAVLIVNPNNPTGSYFNDHEISELDKICGKYRLSVISDEVFGDYSSSEYGTTALKAFDAPVFVLNGVSKLLALPQMKLAWIIVQAERELKKEILNRLEVIADTYLSVNTPSQNALGQWMKRISDIQGEIKSRIKDNWQILNDSAEDDFTVLPCEGGWSAVIQMRNAIDDFAYELLKQKKVYVHPHYFYDFADERNFVVSLLTPSERFSQGLVQIKEFARTMIKK